MIFAIPFSEMGISPLTLSIIIISSLGFIITFGISSKYMDNEGIMKWMMEKPENWVGNSKREK